MDKVERKLQKVIYAFIMSVIIIVAAFAVTIYYYETKEISKAAVVEGLFAKAFVDENVGSAPLNASFSALLFNFEGTPTYHWEFGDGNTSNEMNPTHNYTKEGEYTCNLTVIDITGEIVTTSVKILVVTNKAPQVIIIIEPVESNRKYIPILSFLTFIYPINVQIGDPLFANFLKTLPSSSPLLKQLGDIACTAQVLDYEGDDIVSYEWELKQPSISVIGKQDWPTFPFGGKDLSNITFPMLYVYRTGQYNVKLTVTDSAGNKGSDSKTFRISRNNFEQQKRDLKNTVKRSWENFWKTNFQYLPPDIRQSLPGAMWSILGPIQTSMDKAMERLPEKLRSIVQPFYNFWWQQNEQLYRKPNNPPNMPSNPSPANNATGVDLNADLSWNCSDPDGNPLKYDIYFGTTSPPPLVNSGWSNTTFPLGPLQPSTMYYWKIAVKDSPSTGGSKTVTGDIWSFTT